jgi:hypothetical protein
LEDIYIKTLNAVVSLGLNRLRVWRYHGDIKQAKLVYSGAADHEYKLDNVVESSSEEDNDFSIYCGLIIARYRTDPWARAQGDRFFGFGDDPTAVKVATPLHTDLIVAPVVQQDKTILWGYLSADRVSQSNSGPGKNFYLSDEIRNRAQCGMSVIAVAFARSMQIMEETKRHLSAGVS